MHPPENSDPPGFLAASTVAVIGLGLMGSSLALALQGQCKAVLGVDSSTEVIDQALERQIVERCSTDPFEILPGADIIILAVPVQSILAWIKAIPAYHHGPAIVLDLGSTKQEIVQAMQGMPPAFDPVGGHPMAGKEKLGIAHAEPGIFSRGPFMLTALERSSGRARSLAEEIVRAAGTQPVWIEPEMHDRLAAAASHLPFLLSAALVKSIPLEAKPLIGTGFRSASRLAATPTSMIGDVLKTNRENILASLESFLSELELLVDLLDRQQYDTLEQMLDQIRQDHHHLTGAQ